MTGKGWVGAFPQVSGSDLLLISHLNISNVQRPYFCTKAFPAFGKTDSFDKSWAEKVAIHRMINLLMLCFFVFLGFCC